MVTGGAGFIGNHIVRQLAAAGEAVRVLDLAVPSDLPPQAEMVQGSILDRGTLDRALAGATALYHLAGNAQLWARDKRDFARINHQGTRNVLAAAAEAGVARVVHTSSLTVLVGADSPRRPATVDEETHVPLGRMLGAYCRSKLLAEQEALAWAGRGLPVVVVIPTLPVGPGDRGLTPPGRMILDLVNGRIPAILDCRLDLIDVRDLAAGHIAACRKGRPGERYILGHRDLRLSGLLRVLEEITGLPMPRRRVPYGIAWLAAVVSEGLSDYVTHRPPKAPLTGVRLARHPLGFRSDKAVAELGLPRSPVGVALRDQILWLRDRGLISRPLPALGG